MTRFFTGLLLAPVWGVASFLMYFLVLFSVSQTAFFVAGLVIVASFIGAMLLFAIQRDRAAFIVAGSPGVLILALFAVAIAINGH